MKQLPNIIGENSLENKPYKLNNIFTEAQNITWEDTVKKINDEYEIYKGKSFKIINGLDYRRTPPTLVCRNAVYPNTFETAYNQVDSEIKGVIDMHTFVSFVSAAPNYGKHRDNQVVLIVQAIGSIKYDVSGIDQVTLNPGEALYIPKFIDHKPIITGPRVTLSFRLE